MCSSDLNVTQRMLALADGLVAYRTYPHIDMAQTGRRAAHLLRKCLSVGHKASTQSRRLPFLIALNAQSTWMAPAQEIYEELEAIEAQTGCMLSFCMGFPASDFFECGPVVWGHGGDVQQGVQRLWDRVHSPQQWRSEFLPAPQAIRQALDRKSTRLNSSHT